MDAILDWAGIYWLQIFAALATLFTTWRLARALQLSFFIVLAIVAVGCVIALPIVGFEDVVNWVGGASVFFVLASFFFGASGSGSINSGGHDGSGGDAGSEPFVPYGAPAGFNPYEQDYGAHSHGYDPDRDPSNRR